MVRQLFLTLCATAWTLAALPADDKGLKDDKPLTDNEFVMKVAADGMHEVELGKLAMNNAASPEVKKFGERMVADHTKANEELKTAAGKASITLPDRLPAEKTKELDTFKNLKGAEFDKAYISHMVKDHEKAVTMFTKASKDLKDPALKGFAEKTLPTLQDHLKTAKKINDNIGKQ